MKSSKKSKESVGRAAGPKITQGSHLTVIEHENGRTELKWDDRALLRDVQQALKSLQPAVEKKPRARKTKV